MPTHARVAWAVLLRLHMLLCVGDDSNSREQEALQSPQWDADDVRYSYHHMRLWPYIFMAKSPQWDADDVRMSIGMSTPKPFRTSVNHSYEHVIARVHTHACRQRSMHAHVQKTVCTYVYTQI